MNISLSLTPRILYKTLICSLLSLPILVEAKQESDVMATGIGDFSHWQAVTDSTLSSLRGGFVLGNGVVVDINFQKSIFRNGELTSHSYFQSPQDLNFLGKDEFNLRSVLPNNTLNTVIQNTLDNQTLSAITNIDITIKNLEQAQQAFAHSELYNTFFDARTHQ
ncbi:MAG: hypothetical protein V7733_07215 [Paraglaciecola polaris]|uniref:hypothetical protein n=1 Tax=Paraglaciecola polaris TaxID=222814 RepID=UPI003001F530|tara:strand:- start:4780 stop:5271 length:492 start_codon:yes stop_codon:yes gene_type:complete